MDAYTLAFVVRRFANPDLERQLCGDGAAGGTRHEAVPAGEGRSHKQDWGCGSAFVVLVL